MATNTTHNARIAQLENDRGNKGKITSYCLFDDAEAGQPVEATSVTGEVLKFTDRTAAEAYFETRDDLHLTMVIFDDSEPDQTTMG